MSRCTDRVITPSVERGEGGFGAPPFLGGGLLLIEMQSARTARSIIVCLGSIG